ncbi:MAG: molybdenum cofactor guanylyltransferase [Mycobacterium sp.]
MAAATGPASLAGVVLAGGASLRAGRDKAVKLVSDGRAGSEAPGTLVENAVSIIGQRCQPVFVVAAPGQALPDLSAQVVRDDVRGLGPLLATARGLHAAAAAGAKRAFLCAVDVPFLTADLIDVLLDRATEVDADVVLPWDGTNRYLVGVYKTELATRIDELIAAGERNMPALVDHVDTQRVVISEPRPSVNGKPVSGLRRLLLAGR